MRELILYERGRRPADWNEQLAAEERAVFISDLRSGDSRDASGRPWPASRPRSCLVFEGASAARTYCEELVRRVPELRCDVFDRRGRAVLPVEIIVNERYRARLSANWNKRRLIVSAWVLFVSACALFGFDIARGDGGLATILGLNCLGVAARLFMLARGYREQSEPAE